MKSQERHKLKTNELAQFFSELPEKFQKHGSLITTIALIVLIALVGGILARRYLVQGKQQQRDQLFQQMLAADSLQLDALRRAQMGAEVAADPANAILPYDATSITMALDGIAKNAKNNPVGITAGLLQAERVPPPEDARVLGGGHDQDEGGVGRGVEFPAEPAKHLILFALGEQLGDDASTAHYGRLRQGAHLVSGQVAVQ